MKIEKEISIRRLTDHAFLLITFAGFIYTFLLLALNVGRGFDITDESFYILWASNPGDVLASSTQFGHYTGILYSLANGSLAVFRFLGLLLLLITAGIFSHSLERYWGHLSGASVSTYSHWLSLGVILSGTVAYYRYWLLTPSYNWLALISVLLVATGLLHAAVNARDRNADSCGDMSLFRCGLLVGIGGGLSFMAKPTTAAVLAVIFLYFIGVTSLRRRWKVFVAVSVLFSAIFIIMHAIIFDNGLLPFYVKCRDGLELGRLLGAGNTIRDIFLQAYGDLKQIPNRLVQVFPLIYTGLAFLSLFFASVFTRYRKTQNKGTGAIFVFMLVLVSAVAWIQLWKTGYWVGGTFVGTRIGFGGLAFSVVLFFSGFLTLVFWNKGKSDGDFSGVQFRELVKLYIFLLLLAMAYGFGSGNGLVRQMSGGFVFLCAASLYSAFWIDHYIGKKYLGNAVSLLIVLSVCVILNLAYQKPYRLPGKISDQVVRVTFVDSNKTISVDEKTAKYMNDLKSTALEAGWKPGMYLIDLTGGSPGATVILGGRAPGTPWLAGAFKGSNDFARAALAKVSTSTLQSAWVLTAPKGSRKLSNKVLSDLGLEFPNAYEVMGKVRTGHRNEEQVLWKQLFPVKKVCISIQGVPANFTTIFREQYSSCDKLRFMLI